MCLGIKLFSKQSSLHNGSYTPMEQADNKLHNKIHNHCQLLVTLLNSKGIRVQEIEKDFALIIKVGSSEDVMFAKRSECSDKARHATIWQKSYFI